MKNTAFANNVLFCGVDAMIGAIIARNFLFIVKKKNIWEGFFSVCLTAQEWCWSEILLMP